MHSNIGMSNGFLYLTNHEKGQEGKRLPRLVNTKKTSMLLTAKELNTLNLSSPSEVMKINRTVQDRALVYGTVIDIIFDISHDS